jgi:hypothetical protein
VNGNKSFFIRVSLGKATGKLPPIKRMLANESVQRLIILEKI